MRHLSLGVGILLCAVAVHAQTPVVPQGASRPGEPVPRPQVPVRDNSANPTPTGTARIRGRVVSAETGAPLRRATVRVSSTELRVNRSVNTDAEGRFEINELAAGRYNLFVTRNGYVSLQFGQRRPFESGRPLEVTDSQIIDKIDFALPRGGVIAGRITDELGEPLAGIRMQAMRYQYLPNGQRQLGPAGIGMFNIVTNDLGEFRLYGLMPGTYVVSASPSEFPMVVMPGAPPSPTDFEGHSVTYFPGTMNPDEAQQVTVGIAEEAQASFAMVATKMSRISGVARTSTGKPLSNVMLMLRTRGGNNGGMMRMIPGMAVDGKFSIANVPPGDHWLEIMPRSAGEEFASVPITADGRDITDLVITTSPGATISGHVIFEGSSGAAGESMRIMATPADPFGPSPMRMGDATNGAIAEDGRFEVKGVSGRILLAFAGSGFGPPPVGWRVKSVIVNGSDVTDIPIDIAATGSIADVQVTLTDKQTTLSGTVKGSGGTAVTDYTVVIFPDRRREGAVTSRYTRVVRPDQQGRFEIRGLPPGEYFGVAVDSLEQGRQFDPAFRQLVEPAGKRFTLTEGQSSILDLTLMP